MKKKVLLKALLISGLMLTSCQKEDYNPNVANLQADIDEVTNLAQSGSWGISSFVESGIDSTANFAGYQFSFNQDGSLIADSNNDNVAGTWSITLNDNSDENNNTVGINDNDNQSVDNNVDSGNETNIDSGEISGDNGNNDDGNAVDNGNTGNDDCNNCIAPELLEMLTSCPEWFIDKLERNDEDLDDMYSNYRFDFSEDGTLIAKTESTTYFGTWESSGSDNNIMVTINVPNLEEMNDTWGLHEIESENGEKKVDLRIGGDDRLRFKNRCGTSAKSNSEVVANPELNLNFNIFFANSTNFSELSGQWEIVSHTAIKIELIIVDNDNDSVDLLTFERN